MEFKISEERRAGGVVIISVEGRLNAVTTGELKDKIKALIGEAFIHIVLNLSDTSFIDSSGLSAIVSALKGVREKDGSLKLVGVNANVKKVFELTRLERIFEFYDNVDQAIVA
jgi:anti-sigma B factor antagonist